jgi:tetrahydromethanopterin S-methyltransferase subunit D
MNDSTSSLKSYLLAGLIGAALGGISVAIISRALPSMLSRIFSGMMANMMSQMCEGGFDPGEL